MTCFSWSLQVSFRTSLLRIGLVNVAPEQHRDELADLVDVVLLLPFPDLAPGDLGRRVEEVERVGRDSAPVHLVGGDPEVPQLETLILADEDIERGEIAMHGLAPMEDVQGLQDGGDFVADESLRLASLGIEPGAEVAVFRVFHDQAITGAGTASGSTKRSYTRRARACRSSSWAKYASRTQSVME